MGITRIEKAYRILRNYNGSNNQILLWKYMDEEKKMILEDFSVQYILANHDYEEKQLNKVVTITRDCGLKLKEKYNLTFIPERILIHRIIGEMGGSYHLYMQLTTKGDKNLAYIKKHDIITPFDIKDYHETEVDFERYNKMTEESGRRLLSHQEDAIKFLVTNKKSILADSMGLGKAQPVDTIIPTPDGKRNIGDLKVGDLVYSSDGKPHKVIGVFPQGRKDVYRVEFDDGERTRCCGEHIWIVRDVYHNETEWKTKTLQEMYDEGWVYNYTKHNLRPVYEIPITHPVIEDEVEHYIDPYIIGLYIMHVFKEPLVDPLSLPIPKPFYISINRMNPLLKDGYTIEKEKWLGAINRYRVVKNGVSDEENAFGKEITRLGLNVRSAERTIPDEYVHGSIEQRLSLLQGIMDGHGKFGRNGRYCKFITLNEDLAYKMKEIILSLGGICKIRRSRLPKRPYRMQYFMMFHLNMNPFRLVSQAARYEDNLEKHANYHRGIKEIKKDGTAECVCIKVDSDDESYLTTNYIVTHNTTTSIISALAGEFNNILVITKANLKTQWKKEISLYENPDNIEIVKGSKWTPGKKFTVINYDIIGNFYEVPKEIEYQTEPDGKGGYVYVRDDEGNKVPVWIKNPRTKMYEPKMVKSKKKTVINEAMDKSPLYQDEYDCVIIDECHLLSNKKSKRYEAISDFLNRSNPKAIYLVTGTPITKNTEKLYNILKLIKHPVVGDYEYYMKQYCGAKEHTFRGVKRLIPEGSTNLEELKDKIKDSYIRRVFEDLPNMPKKTIFTKEYDLDLRQQLTYNRLWDDYINAQYEKNSETNASDYQQLIEGGLVRRYLAMEMVENTIELVDAEIENGEKVVIMCNFTDELNKFKEYYKEKCVVYDGSNTVTDKKKLQSVEAFLNDPNVMVFIGNIVSASVGLNLDVSNTLVFNSYSWVAADNAQAEDRIYRVTQKRPCKVVYMLWTDSISKDMYDKVMRKKEVANEVIKKENDK